MKLLPNSMSWRRTALAMTMILISLAAEAPAFARSSDGSMQVSKMLSSASTSGDSHFAQFTQPLARVVPPMNLAAADATVRGSVFYNDRRTYGLFDERKDVRGNPGRRCPKSGKRDRVGNQATGDSCRVNWLAGKHMTVEVIERDTSISPKVASPGCRSEELLTTVKVAQDGSFSATFPTTDDCASDLISGAAIELRVKLQSCNSSYCFSINRAENQPYFLSHPQASARDPLAVQAGADITLDKLNYSTATDPTKPNNDSIAANYYASIVDTILTLHEGSTIPFFKEEFGEIQYVFPSTDSDSAKARSASLVVVSNYLSKPQGAKSEFNWIPGDMPAHEYGHVQMLRAWNGTYGFDGIGKTATGSTIAPSKQIAFKEGWAEFISRSVFSGTRSCKQVSFDINNQPPCDSISQTVDDLEKQHDQQLTIIAKLKGHRKTAAQELLSEIATQLAEQRLAHMQCLRSNISANLPGALGEGAFWRDNVAKALCDWFDDRYDDDPRLAGTGDRIKADIHSMWLNLRLMKPNAPLYGGQVVNPGLWFCDYVSYYLNVRQSVSAVGAGPHADSVARIRDLIYNNNIACGMQPPP